MPGKRNAPVQACFQDMANPVHGYGEEVVLFPLAPDIRAALVQKVGARADRLYITAPRVKGNRCSFSAAQSITNRWVG